MEPDTTFPILKYFAYSHLPPHLQEVSKPFSDVAMTIAATGSPDYDAGTWAALHALGRSIEFTEVDGEANWAVRKIIEAKGMISAMDRPMALRKLLEAKDCAVRAKLG